MTYDVTVKWDDEAGVWYAYCDDIPLALENDTIDTLLKRVKTVALEVLELNNKPTENVSLCFKVEHLERIA